MSDLISREDLKKDFKTAFWQESQEVYLQKSLSIIDNAPTVENITVFCEGADEETLDNIKKELEKVLDKLKERNDE